MTKGARRIPDGLTARERGYQIQGRIAAEIESLGYFTWQGYDKDEPDIVVYRDREMAQPDRVVSVKSFTLVPAGERGRRASGRRITREDVWPELAVGQQLRVPVELVVVNMTNGGRGRWALSSEFEGMTTNYTDLQDSE